MEKIAGQVVSRLNQENAKKTKKDIQTLAEAIQCLQKDFKSLKRNQSRTNGPINAHLTIAQVMPKYNHNNEAIANQSSYPTGIKNTTYVEANVRSMYAKFRLHPLYGFWEEDF